MSIKHSHSKIHGLALSLMKKRSETKFLSRFSHLSTFNWEFWLLKPTTSKIRIFSQRLKVFVLFIFSSFVLDCSEDLENKSATEILFINIKRNFKCWKFTVVHALVGISFLIFRRVLPWFLCLKLLLSFIKNSTVLKLMTVSVIQNKNLTPSILRCILRCFFPRVSRMTRGSEKNEMTAFCEFGLWSIYPNKLIIKGSSICLFVCKCQTSNPFHWTLHHFKCKTFS